MTLYHGGAPGLKPGERILPPSQTGAKSLADVESAPDEMRDELTRVYRRDRVYLTAHAEGAALFAAAFPNGDTDRGGSIYEVIPEGVITTDPDWNGPPGESVCAASAVIVAVVADRLPREPYLSVLLAEEAL